MKRYNLHILQNYYEQRLADVVLEINRLREENVLPDHDLSTIEHLATMLKDLLEVTRAMGFLNDTADQTILDPPPAKEIWDWWKHRGTRSYISTRLTELIGIIETIKPQYPFAGLEVHFSEALNVWVLCDQHDRPAEVNQLVSIGAGHHYHNRVYHIEPLFDPLTPQSLVPLRMAVELGINAEHYTEGWSIRSGRTEFTHINNGEPLTVYQLYLGPHMNPWIYIPPITSPHHRGSLEGAERDAVSPAPDG